MGKQKRSANTPTAGATLTHRQKKQRRRAGTALATRPPTPRPPIPLLTEREELSSAAATPASAEKTTVGHARRSAAKTAPERITQPKAQPISVPASVRKYPTLARMAAIAPRPAVDQRASVSARMSLPELPQLPPEQDASIAITEPVPVVPPNRTPVVTRRLAEVAEPQAASEISDAWHSSGPRQESTGHAHPWSLPPAEPVPVIAVIHSAICTVAAISGVTMLLLGRQQGFWPLSLAAITGLSGWIAYALTQRQRTRAFAGYLLIAGQMAAAAWLIALVGPRVSIVVAIVPLAILAISLAGWNAAVMEVTLAATGYFVAVVLSLQGLLAPTVVFSSADAAVFDGVFLCLALGGSLVGLRSLVKGRLNAERVATARLHEATLLRGQSMQMRQQVEEDTEVLGQALAEALRGVTPARFFAHGPLSPLGETIALAVERLLTLQRDREERIHLEGAVRMVTRSVERAWLGLPWTWPEWSGTPLDELIALLRAPRPGDSQMLWAEETPTLVQIPTLDPGISAPRAHDQESQPSFPSNPSGDLIWLDAAHQQAAVGHDAIPPVTRPTVSQSLPWREWDTWNDWDFAHEE